MTPENPQARQKPRTPPKQGAPKHGARWAYVAGAMALAGLVVADVELWRVFVDERAQVQSAADDEALFAAAAAHEALERRLASTFADHRAMLELVDKEPLRPDEDLVLVVAGRQVLPRVGPWRIAEKTTPTQARDDYADLVAGRPHTRFRDAEGDELLDDAEAVVAAPNDAALEATVRAFLALRHHLEGWHGSKAVATLAVIKKLLDTHHADPVLLHALLVEGKLIGAARIEPVAVDLLTARRSTRLTEPEGTALFQVFLDECARAGVSCKTAEERWHELERAPLANLPTHVDNPSLAPGFVYLEPYGDDAVTGILVDKTKLEDEIAADLRARGLLHEDDRVSVVEPAAATNVIKVDVALDAPRLARATSDAAVRFRIKAGLLGVLSALAAALAAAAALDGARRRRYDALRSGFVAAVSHELRTPLASMRLLVESMLTKANDEKSREKLDRLGKDVDGLDFLVENILSFSRLERGKLVPHKDRVSLVEVAAEAADRARADSSAVVTIDVDDSSGASLDVTADLELVQLVVTNLVRNAWQHNTSPDKRVRVVVGAGAGVARVLVEDNGPGVPVADRDRIFVEFERGARAPSRGTGLGLALCRQIARAHGGDVTLASTGPSGSSFVLTLPSS